ncbi:MAG: ABC superfamily ATP binding cassette transporter permease, partial [Actinomyces urogenitalis DORA_12]
MTVRTITALRLEVAKIRRLRLWPVAAVLGVVAVAFSLP